MPTKRYSRNRAPFFVKKYAKLGAFFKISMGHHGHCVRYDESNPKAYAHVIIWDQNRCSRQVSL